MSRPATTTRCKATTGRTVYHWHTRTKPCRAEQLNNAAPRMWTELSSYDVEQLGIAEGDTVRVESPRGHIKAPTRITGTRPGVIFAAFHYGYFDSPPGHQPGTGPGTAANELTRTEWDPVSKQPVYKVTAAKVTKVTASSREEASP